MLTSKKLYVISDLHIGGKYPNDSDEGTTIINRGFRICTQVKKLSKFIKEIGDRGRQENINTELVINGDFIDFLAEEWKGENKWIPFIEDSLAAANQLEKVIIPRDQCFFDALSEFLDKGHKLTIMIGNHDVELSLPTVRSVLFKSLNAEGKKLTFIYDGEAYQVGRVLIEHGNRYDGFNVVDFDGLRQIRSLQSRWEYKNNFVFTPPLGSFLVATIMNKIKESYPFIDLLKPETTAAIPILLALAPQYRKHIFYIASLVHQARQHGPDEEGVIRYKSEISTTINDGRKILIDRFENSGVSPNKINDFFQTLDSSDEIPTRSDLRTEAEIASVSSSTVWAYLQLLVARESKPLSSRLPALLTALQANRSDTSFVRDKEEKQYAIPAERLLKNEFVDVVIFGHTHLPKKVDFDNGVYINSGTWADIIEFPYDLLKLPEDQALTELEKFVKDIESKEFDNYIKSQSNFALIELDNNGKVINAKLDDY